MSKNIYKRCIQLCNNIIENFEQNDIQLPTTSIDELAFPQALVPKYKAYLQSLCKKVYYISDIHLVHKVAKNFNEKATNQQVKSYIKEIVEKLVKTIYFGNSPIIIFGGDISSDFEIAKIFYIEFIKQLEKAKKKSFYNFEHNYIYAILGNHEFWDFENINDCYNSYRQLFKSLEIIFLENTITWFGKHDVPLKKVENTDEQFPKYVELKREENEYDYEKQMRYIYNTIIVGGVGFAGYNNEFNANRGIYKTTLNRNQEIEETYKWEAVYNFALQYAKENNSVLIVLTHNPIEDWKKNSTRDNGCIYFNGHTHKNYLFHDDETNIHVFANNQIGYNNCNVQFKEAYIYKRINPFAGFQDGHHEITSNEYLRFYDYMIERIIGNGLVERQLKNNNAHFYMIKHSGYYGFFLISKKGTHICAGGRIKRISECMDINKFDKDFMNMISRYIKILSPYRNAQEQIAKSVKSFGGDGIIHGCIIDIDFYNHIMLNPIDGTMTFYYSPVFGKIEIHNDLISLLDNHNKLLANNYRKQLEETSYKVELKKQIDIHTKMVEVDIKNSLYAISNRMSQLQRLFDKNILRDWNQGILLDDVFEKNTILPFNNGSE